ncbi:class I SAM-dependent methyltransferase [Robertkochia sediminum]|uniref:class I SAM-dependent methyltransferase n=1 Tax=Robertkochia sediminum TaxID=2785326 RepID=UPI001933D68A|nr:class I SAM-dependent methyltransferase [Robertkochia sediminum]MBL7473963.1 class I SAM-dependent methyltransferase [Robertkochia sediminum]
MSQETLYNPAFVADLFNRMSTSYTAMNSITSFGFYPLWRKLAIKKLSLKPGAHVADLLAGPGECWKHLLHKIGPEGRLTALDFSEGMMGRARQRKQHFSNYQIELLQKNVFHSGIPDNSQDAVVCCYGLKTFSEEQLGEFAEEIMRILKPGGTYSLVEVAMPKNQLLRKGYHFYLKHVIPFISKKCVRFPETYNYLEVYSNRFGGFDHLNNALKTYNGNPQMEDLTWGCAKRIWGFKS